MREETREWFNERPGTDGIYRYIEELEGGEPPVRIQAAVALGESQDPRAVRPLVKFCEDEDAELRRTVVEALCMLESVRSVGALVERLKDRTEDGITRRRAADALGAIRSYSAIDGLVERVLDADEDLAIRVHVAEVLGRVRSREACEALKICLTSGQGVLKTTAEEALRMLEGFPTRPGDDSPSQPFTGQLSSHPGERYSTGSFK